MKYLFKLLLIVAEQRQKISFVRDEFNGGIDDHAAFAILIRTRLPDSLIKQVFKPFPDVWLCTEKLLDDVGITGFIMGKGLFKQLPFPPIGIVQTGSVDAQMIDQIIDGSGIVSLLPKEIHGFFQYFLFVK